MDPDASSTAAVTHDRAALAPSMAAVKCTVAAAADSTSDVSACGPGPDDSTSARESSLAGLEPVMAALSIDKAAKMHRKRPMTCFSARRIYVPAAMNVSIGEMCDFIAAMNTSFSGMLMFP